MTGEAGIAFKRPFQAHEHVKTKVLQSFTQAPLFFFQSPRLGLGGLISKRFVSISPPTTTLASMEKGYG